MFEHSFHNFFVLQAIGKNEGLNAVQRNVQLSSSIVCYGESDKVFEPGVRP